MDKALEVRVLGVVAAQVGKDPSEIPVEKSFAELGLESMDAFEILFVLEDEFEIDIPDEAAHSIDTIARLVEVVSETLGGS